MGEVRMKGKIWLAAIINEVFWLGLGLGIGFHPAVNVIHAVMGTAETSYLLYLNRESLRR